MSEPCGSRTTERHPRPGTRWTLLAALALGSALALGACTGPGLEPPGDDGAGAGIDTGSPPSGGRSGASGGMGAAAGTGGSPAGASGAGGAGGLGASGAGGAGGAGGTGDEPLDAGVLDGGDEDAGALR